MQIQSPFMVLLIIDGGEPLCREDLMYIVKYTSSKGIRTIGSNGTLKIDEPMARKMHKAGPGTTRKEWCPRCYNVEGIA